MRFNATTQQVRVPFNFNYTIIQNKAGEDIAFDAITLDDAKKLVKYLEDNKLHGLAISHRYGQSRVTSKKGTEYIKQWVRPYTPRNNDNNATY